MSLNHSFIVDLASRYLPPPAKFLDFGCGTADLAALAADHGYDAYGVDTFLGVGDSSENLDIAVGKIGARALAIHPDQPMPFEDGFFDIVASNQVFEHVSALDGIGNEIARVIRPGGLLLALMPTSEVLWEDHLKMPWVHRLPVGSKRQHLLIKAFRRMGFGKVRHMPDNEWLSRAESILRGEVFHRPVRDYISAFSRNFRLLAEDEPAWARYRIDRHPLLRHGSALTQM
ncbi:MAG: Methyltransferase type 11, partial [Microvirga sp.]|nr:Methyltransferase type 11 [Microvirga sp.]